VTDDRLTEHVLSKAHLTFRPARGALNHPYLVPGDGYDQQLWDWDSYWLTKGLLELADKFDEGTFAQILDHARGSWLNFFEQQAGDGKIPILITPESPDTFGCTLDATHKRNQAKPVLAQYAWAISCAQNDFGWMKTYYPHLLRFLESWWRYYQSPCGLLVWGGDTAIGVDNDPTTYGRPPFSSANLLLNCLYYQELITAAHIGRQISRVDEADHLAQRAEALKHSILSECWDEQDGFFYTVDVQCRDQRDLFIPPEIPRGMAMNWHTVPLKLKTFTGFLPLWCGIATKEQARVVINRHWNTSNDSKATWGIRTLAKCEKMYAPEIESANPSNWLGPIWIIANYLVYFGFKNYGYDGEASLLAMKTRELLTRDLEQTNTLHECYHPDTGQPNHISGFFSWNTLAAAMR